MQGRVVAYYCWWVTHSPPLLLRQKILQGWLFQWNSQEFDRMKAIHSNSVLVLLQMKYLVWHCFAQCFHSYLILLFCDWLHLFRSGWKPHFCVFSCYSLPQQSTKSCFSGLLMQRQCALRSPCFTPALIPQDYTADRIQNDNPTPQNLSFSSISSPSIYSTSRKFCKKLYFAVSSPNQGINHGQKP